VEHVDYTCCALCDCSLGYDGEYAKEWFCAECAFYIGRYIWAIEEPTTEAFLAWARKAKKEKVKQVLSETQYSKCSRQNEFDTALDEILNSKGED
jgi:hypothetical protein